MKYAIIDGGIVRNIARWDGVTPWDPGFPVVRILDDEACDIGWTYDPMRLPRFEEVPS